MNRREQYKRMVVFFLNAIMLAIEAVPFAYLWYMRYFPFMFNPFYRRGNWAAIGLYLLITFLLTRAYGGYELTRQRVPEACLANVLAIICGNVVGYIEVALLTVHYFPVKDMIVLTIVQGICICLWVIFAKHILSKLYPPRRMMVIYGEYSPAAIMDKIHSRGDTHNVCASVNMKLGLEELYRLIPNYEEVLLYDLPSQTKNKLLKFCFDRSIRTYVTPKVSDIIMASMDDIYTFDVPMFLARNMGLSPIQKFGKRIVDVVLSLIGLIILSPFMLLTAILIKTYDGGPVFYTQERLTINGKPFKIIKFRSMIVDSEKAGARLASKHDDRITPVGKVIRSIHFDEIPQLFNVLIGDMSIVGPRPERPEIFDEYEEVIPEFIFRLKVKAGLTGFAQVHGRYNTTPLDKLKFDMLYIEKYSLLMDFKLMFLTVKILFNRENSEGVADNQTTALKK